MTRAREFVLFSEDPQTGYSIPNGIPKNHIHRSKMIQTMQVVFIYLRAQISLKEK